MDPNAHFAAITTVSPTDVWAVGTKGPDEQGLPLIVHWNGRKVHAVRSPLGSVGFAGVAAVSQNDIWAVGANRDRPVIEHWDGSRWEVVPAPILGRTSYLQGVTALSPTDAWAVGQAGIRPLAEHWNGRRWRVIDMRREGALYAIDGAAADQVWAVGEQGLTALSVNDIFGLVLRWNGRRWQQVAAPDRSDGLLGYETLDGFSGVDAISSGEAWATHNGVVRGDIQRWDGRRWRVAHVFPRPSILDDIAALSPRDVWAVGRGAYGAREGRPLIVHWNGSTWRAQQAPVGRRRATLTDVSALAPDDIWAAGDHLIARYSCYGRDPAFPASSDLVALEDRHRPRRSPGPWP
jgi:hypothetical protein